MAYMEVRWGQKQDEKLSDLPKPKYPKPKLLNIHVIGAIFTLYLKFYLILFQHVINKKFSVTYFTFYSTSLKHGMHFTLRAHFSEINSATFPSSTGTCSCGYHTKECK